MAINKEYKIRFTGGLGDCLKMLSEQTSLFEYYKRHGLLVYWVYSDQNLVDIVYKQYKGSKVQNGHWAYIRDYDMIDYNTGASSSISGAYPVHQSLYDLLKNFEFFLLVPQETFANLNVPELNNYRMCDYPEYAYSNQLKGLFDNEKGGWQIEVESEWVRTQFKDSNQTFCVQLSGSNPAKHYNPSNYVRLFKLILNRFPEAKIFLIDRPTYQVDSTMLFDDRIVNLVGKVSMIQCAELIQSVDYLIAPDSYSKYIRQWVDKKQIVICTKLDCHPDVPKMLQDAFNYVGLLNNPDVKLLGVTYTITDNIVDAATIVNSMNDISPEEIFNQITDL